MQPQKMAEDILNALKASKQGFIAVGVFSFFVNILMLTAPLYMLQVYDRVVASRNLETLLVLTLLMLFLFAVMGVLEWLRSRILVRIGNQLDVSLSQRVYSAMFEMGVKKPEVRSAQPLSDFTSIRQFLTGNGPFAFFDAPWLPIYVAVLFLFHPAFGWFAIGAAITLLIIAILNEKMTKKQLGEANSESVKAQNLASSNINNAEVLYAMGMLPGIMSRWYKQHQRSLIKQTEASDKAGIFANLSKVLRMIFQSAILGLGAYYVVINEMSPGMMIAGSILLGRALAPMDLLINSWSGFNNARSAYVRLSSLLTAIPALQRKMPLPDPRGKVEFEALVVVPPGSQTAAIRGIQFQVNPGEHVGIIGPSAAGKSTLARAILGVWPAANGAVRIDGAEVNHYNRDELGPHVGYLPQDIELFDGSISENIARFGEVNSEKVVEAAKKAGVHELILHLPNAYDTIIGSTSGVLSGGQRQRIGLARALYGNPKVIVLDEPNSNLDEQGEQALAQTLEQLQQEGTTAFIVSHRPSLLRQVDKLLLLKDGQVADYGQRDQVMRRLAEKSNQQAPVKH